MTGLALANHHVAGSWTSTTLPVATAVRATCFEAIAGLAGRSGDCFPGRNAEGLLDHWVRFPDHRHCVHRDSVGLLFAIDARPPRRPRPRFERLQHKTAVFYSPLAPAGNKGRSDTAARGRGGAATHGRGPHLNGAVGAPSGHHPPAGRWCHDRQRRHLLRSIVHGP